MIHYFRLALLLAGIAAVGAAGFAIFWPQRDDALDRVAGVICAIAAAAIMGWLYWGRHG